MPSPCGFDKILVYGAANNFSDYNGIYTWQVVPVDYPNGGFIKTLPESGRVVIFITEGENYTGKWQIYRNLPNFYAVEDVNCPTEVINWVNPFGAPGTPPTSIVPYIERTPYILRDVRATNVRVKN